MGATSKNRCELLERARLRYLNRGKEKGGGVIRRKKSRQSFQRGSFQPRNRATARGWDERGHAFGNSNQNRLLTVTFTVPKNNLRVILARPMNKRERKNYALEQTEKDIMDDPLQTLTSNPRSSSPFPQTLKRPQAPLQTARAKPPAAPSAPAPKSSAALNSTSN